MTDAATSASPLESAGRRLERAVIALERKLSGMNGAASADYANADTAALAQALEQALARERALAAAAQEAAVTLGRAADEIRAVLAEAPDAPELETV
jgi:hypothetical protein